MSKLIKKHWLLQKNDTRTTRFIRKVAISMQHEMLTTWFLLIRTVQ